MHVLHDGEIPCGQPWTSEHVSGYVAESTSGRDLERICIEPCGRATQNHWARKRRVPVGADWIACISVIGRVEAQLRREGKSGLDRDDAVQPSSADDAG